MRLWLAIRAFFATCFHAAVAERIQRVLDEPAGLESPHAAEATAPPLEPETRRPAKAKGPARSEAVTLLSALQRESRFVDLVQESLDQYTDEQVGAAARDVLRDCRAVLNRLFAIEPVVDQSEGASVEVPAGFDPGEFRLSGKVTGEPPFRGRLVHHGWKIAKCELPDWSGSQATSGVVAAAEVEV
jgi:hypothetical protein